MVLTGLLPECRAAMELGERERRRLEGEVTKAVVEAQEIVVSMLREYREVTRRARAAKQEALDSWWAAERTRRRHRRELHAKVRKGLEGMAAQRRLERKRRLDSLLDAVAGAAHFAVPDARARDLHAALRDRLPGFLVPRLAREEPGAGSKTVLAG